jgi:dTDP-4-dehydrorhamnose reductase
MRILLIGGSGLLGSNLILNLHKNYDLISTYNKHKVETKKFKFIELDVTNYKNLKELLIDFKPNIVIHTAAISRPELCENMDYENLYEYNVRPAEYLSELCNKTGSRLFFTSTDLVYDESLDEIDENSKLNPSTKYAKSKVDAENVIASISKNYVILRTALLLGFCYFGEINSNFHKNYISLNEGEKVNLYIDQVRTPLSVIEAGRIIEKLFNADIQNDILNFCGKDFVTRYEIGKILAKKLKVSYELINPIELSKLDVVNKVLSLKLKSDKLDALYKERIDIEKAIDELVRNYENNKDPFGMANFIS